MVDERVHTDPEPYNPIEFIQLTPLTKEGIKREALKVLEAESAVLKAANFARNIGNALVFALSYEGVRAGGAAFLAKGRRDPSPTCRSSFRRRPTRVAEGPE